MSLAIEDYALIGNCRTGALVGVDGSIDWLCLPRFDSPSTFAALLGDEDHGHWTIAPVGADRCTDRRYDGDTFTLVTRWVTPEGEIEVTDLMPIGGSAEVIRRVRGIRGTVACRTVLRIRFDYSAATPWIRQAREKDVPETHPRALIAAAGPDSVVVRGPRLHADGHAHHAEFEVSAGETVDFTMTWYRSHRRPPRASDVDRRIAATHAWWTDWAARIAPDGRYDAAKRRSLLVLRALTHEATAGIVAAVTTSLPEDFGGMRNWDYRFVWLRDASLTLTTLMRCGFGAEATAWRSWLLRAVAGDPEDLQIMYGLAGERRLEEWEVDTLPGYQGAAPVRVGNAAYTQYQADVFGEVMLALDEARAIGIPEDGVSWPLQVALLRELEDDLDRKDNGIWEIRGDPQMFTHSRAMAWAAFDCGIRAVREHGLHGPADHWETLRDRLRAEIEELGYDADRGTYVQHYGSREVDAALLVLPHIGYLAADDPRMLGTVAAIEHDLMRDGLVMRYRTETGVDGLDPGEHPFLACSFWLVEQYSASGRLDEAVALMDRLVGFVNDVGMLSEEYDPINDRHAGNTPQAFSHLTLIRAANAIERAGAAASEPPSASPAPPSNLSV